MALGIIVASSGLVNAADGVLTEKKPHLTKRIEKLRAEIHSEGLLAPLVNRGERHGLKAGMKIKHLTVKTQDELRTCDLIYNDGGEELAKPKSLLLLDRRDDKNGAFFSDYHFDLNGKLLSAAISTGRKDADGKPIKGSLEEKMLDANDKDVVASANKSLDYWLSGAYKKHMPMKKGGAAPESAKKHAATTAR